MKVLSLLNWGLRNGSIPLPLDEKHLLVPRLGGE